LIEVQQTHHIEYDLQGLANISTLAGDVEKVNVTYESDTATSYLNAKGRKVTYNFATPYNTKRAASINGDPTANCLETNTTINRDPNGYYDYAINARNFTTNYTINNRGLEEARTEAVGTNEERTYSTQWHTIYRVETQKTEPNHTIGFIYYPNTALLQKRTETDSTNFTYLI
jgi:hypothetical protein